MNEIWVLSVKTSLPGTFYNSNDTHTTFFAYDSFEKGRTAVRNMLSEYALHKNSMFDGNGKITQLARYIDIMDEGDDPDNDEYLTKKILSAVQEALKFVFEGKEVSIEALEEGYYHDWCVYMEYFGLGVAIGGDDLSNSDDYCLPDINTNMFSMQEERDYYMYIVDDFGQDEDPSILLIDLKKVCVN